jgi:polyisoprenoid-binding protein YceI
MNKLFLFCFILVASCKTAPRAHTSVVSVARPVPQASGTTYLADVSKSSIEWIGTSPISRHHGTFKLTEGALIVGDNSVKGGRFIIDINSLTPDDQKPEQNKKLQEHLLSSDFFHVVHFPLAEFHITSITPAAHRSANSYNVTGNLKLKDIIKSITFPASIQVDRSTLTATASFNFDRSLWNMSYGNDQSLGNKFIRPDVNITLHLIASRS